MSRAVTEEEMTQGISRLEAHTAQIREEAKAAATPYPGPSKTAHRMFTICCTGAHLLPNTGKENMLPTTAMTHSIPATASFFTLFLLIF